MMLRPLATALIAVGLAVTFACSEDESKPRTRNTKPPEKAQTSAVAPAPAPGINGPAPGPAPGPGSLSDEGSPSPGPGPSAGPGPAPGPGSPPAPKITFVQPKTAQNNVHEFFNVELSFANIAADAKWSLYRTTAQGATTGGTALVSARPISNGTAAVDTAALPNGTFYVHARIDGAPAVATAFGFPITVAHPGAPVINFVKPTAGGAKMTSVDVEVSFQNVPGASTWTLYAATTAGAIDGGMALESTVPVGTTTKTVNIGGLATNVYYLYAKVDGSTAVVTSPHALSVGNRAPVMNSLTVGSFNANTVFDQKRAFAYGETLPLAFAGTDPDGDPLTYEIEYTEDLTAGTPAWTPIVAAHNDDEYDFVIPNGITATLTYGIRVRASDGASQSGWRASTAPFGVRDAAPSYADIDPVLSNRCAPCHVSGGTQYVARPYDTYVAASTPAGAIGIWNRGFVADNMPPAGAANGDLTTPDKNLVQYWLWFQTPP